jgi:uncharacterized protein YcbX
VGIVACEHGLERSTEPNACAARTRWSATVRCDSAALGAEEASVELSEIRVHPIKSLRGVTVDEARVLPAGLEHDRRWMLVDQSGTFVSQREEPRLACLGVELVEGGYRVTSEGDELVVPRTHEGPRVRVHVWGTALAAVVYEPGGTFFSDRLGRPLRLVCLPDDVVRTIVGERGRPGDRVSFADAFPYLLIGQASLDLLNTRLPAPPLPMTRFRPNFVVTGSEPHAEDGWARLRIGSVPFRGVQRCDRCSMTTIDPITGDKGLEPLRTLASYRREDGKVWFGMNLVPDAEGRVRVGDEVEVVDE